MAVGMWYSWFMDTVILSLKIIGLMLMALDLLYIQPRNRSQR